MRQPPFFHVEKVLIIPSQIWIHLDSEAIVSLKKGNIFNAYRHIGKIKTQHTNGNESSQFFRVSLPFRLALLHILLPYAHNDFIICAVWQADML